MSHMSTIQAHCYQSVREAFHHNKKQSFWEAMNGKSTIFWFLINICSVAILKNIKTINMFKDCILSCTG